MSSNSSLAPARREDGIERSNSGSSVEPLDAFEAAHLPRLRERVRDPRARRELIENRLRLDAAGSDPRPLALVVYPKGDHTGAFSAQHGLDNLAHLTKSHRVVYYEVDSDEALLRACKEATQSRPADLLIIGGHGNRFGILFDELHNFYRPGRSLDVFFDEQKFERAGFGDFLKPGGEAVAYVCNGGNGGPRGLNVARLLHRLAPHVTVQAPTGNVHAAFQFTSTGEWIGPGFIRSDGTRLNPDEILVLPAQLSVPA